MEFIRDGRRQVVYAKKEVILSAGKIHIQTTIIELADKINFMNLIVVNYLNKPFAN